MRYWPAGPYERSASRGPVIRLVELKVVTSMRNPYSQPVVTLVISGAAFVGAFCLSERVPFGSARLLLLGLGQWGLAATFLGARALPEFGCSGLSPGRRNLSWAWAHREQPRPALFPIGLACALLTSLGVFALSITVFAAR